MLKKLGSILFGGTIGTIVTAGIYHKEYQKDVQAAERNKYYLDMVSTWLSNKNAGKSMANYLIENNVKSIAIYGVGTLGELFYEEVEKTDIAVKCFIDKSAKEECVGPDSVPVIPVWKIESQDKIDAIIITPMAYYDAVMDDLKKQEVKVSIFSLEDMIYNMK